MKKRGLFFYTLKISLIMSVLNKKATNNLGFVNIKEAAFGYFKISDHNKDIPYDVMRKICRS